MKLSDLSQLFKCLSDPVRCRILNLLMHEDVICVCDIVSSLGLPQSVVSRHLAYLRKHGLVEAERRGNWQYYSHTLFSSNAEVRSSQAKVDMMQQLKMLLALEPGCQQDVMNLSEDKHCC